MNVPNKHIFSQINRSCSEDYTTFDITFRMIYWTAVFCIFLVYTLFLNVDTAPRIVNGTNASPGQYPYQVSLRRRGTHFCGGTIIERSWILTAAHCVDGENVPDLTVLAGTINLSSGGTEIQVASYIKHSGYNKDNAYENDIAVIKLASPLTYGTYIQAARLPGAMQQTPGGATATVIGWGLLYTDGPSSNTLLQVNLITYSDAACSEALYGYPHEHNLCAGVPEGGKGHCSGDSGGPLLVNGVQVGVVSWSAKPCGLQGFPGVYTEVSYFISWITAQLN